MVFIKIAFLRPQLLDKPPRYYIDLVTAENNNLIFTSPNVLPHNVKNRFTMRKMDLPGLWLNPSSLPSLTMIETPLHLHRPTIVAIIEI